LFLDIDLNLKPQKPQLFLCKPNKEIIGKLNESFDINLKLSLRQLNELSFSLPYEIEINHELKFNDNINKLKERYLIKLVLGNYTEWFIINELIDNMNEDNDNKEVHTFSLGYELRDKLIRDYSVTSYNATQVLTEVLSSSIWTIDYIDADFDIMYRSFNVSNATLLDFVYQIAETFNALVVWDTLNRTISFYKSDNVGIDRGFKINYGKYLKSLNKISSVDEMVTRLKVFGKDELSIQRVNPTGTNYIEDFTYFIHPYEEDVDGNIIKHSDYMSDGLCKAIIVYNDLLETKKGDFDALLTQKETLQNTLTTKENELSTLETELAVIQDNLDIAQSTGVGDEEQLKIDLQNKENEIANKESEITSVENDISNIDSQITTLQNEISIENNFTPEQIVERNQFIIEKEWSNENIYDDKELYNKAIETFQDIREPQIIFELDIVNFLEIIEEQLNWDKLQLGDIINVQYDKLNINISTKIIEIYYNFENADINLTIANTKDIKTDDDDFLKEFYNVISTSSIVDMNKFKWQTAFSTSNEVSTILNNTWDSAKREIISGVNNSVTVNERGVTISNSADPLKYIRMTNGVIGLTQDGGNTFGVAIDSSGVYAEKLIGEIIAGNNLTIVNDSGSFSVDGNGVTIAGASLTITNGLPESQINSTSVNKWNNSIQKNTLYNGVKIDTTNGITVSGDNGITTMLNATEGITIGVRNTTNDGWTSKKLYADTSGNLTIEGKIICNELILDGTDILQTIDNQVKINADYLGKWSDGVELGSVGGSTYLTGAYSIDFETSLIRFVHTELSHVGAGTGLNINCANSGFNVYNCSDFNIRNDSSAYIESNGYDITISCNDDIFLDGDVFIGLSAITDNLVATRGWVEQQFTNRGL